MQLNSPDCSTQQCPNILHELGLLLPREVLVQLQLHDCHLKQRFCGLLASHLLHGGCATEASRVASYMVPISLQAAPGQNESTWQQSHPAQQCKLCSRPLLPYDNGCRLQALTAFGHAGAAGMSGAAPGLSQGPPCRQQVKIGWRRSPAMELLLKDVGLREHVLCPFQQDAVSAQQFLLAHLLAIA